MPSTESVETANAARTDALSTRRRALVMRGDQVSDSVYVPHDGARHLGSNPPSPFASTRSTTPEWLSGRRGRRDGHFRHSLRVLSAHTPLPHLRRALELFIGRPHLDLRRLRSGRSDGALAGGTNFRRCRSPPCAHRRPRWAPRIRSHLRCGRLCRLVVCRPIRARARHGRSTRNGWSHACRPCVRPAPDRTGSGERCCQCNWVGGWGAGGGNAHSIRTWSKGCALRGGRLHVPRTDRCGPVYQ